MALSDVKIRNAKASDKPRRLWDGGGLYLEISPSGAKLWRLKYRYQGKEKLLALGKLDVVSLREAREARNEWKKLLAKGLDPATVRKQTRREAAHRAASSFEAVAREWYAKQAQVGVAHHASDVLRRLEADLFPDLGPRPIAEVTAPELLAVLRKIEHRGAYDLAHRILQVASQVIRYGVARAAVNATRHGICAARSPRIKRRTRQRLSRRTSPRFFGGSQSTARLAIGRPCSRCVY